MNFEIIDNLFQVLVLFSAMAASAVTACKRKSRDFLLLAGGYGCFMMGTLYYVLHLIITGDIPQIFYVAEISWLAAYLFFLSLSLSRRSTKGNFPGVISIFCAVLIMCLIFVFQIFGPALLFSLCFVVTEGTIVLRCMEVIRRERKKLEVFYAGEGAMAYVEMLEFNDINKGLDGDFGFFAMPTIEDDEAKGNQEKLYGAPEGMIVNPNSENVDVAVDFVKFLTSVESQQKIVSEAGHTSCTIGAHTEENTIPQLIDGMAYVQNFNGMSNWTDCGFEASIVDTMCKLGQDFAAQSITAEDYVAGLQETAKVVREQNAE